MTMTYGEWRDTLIKSIKYRINDGEVRDSVKIDIYGDLTVHWSDQNKPIQLITQHQLFREYKEYIKQTEGTAFITA